MSVLKFNDLHHSGDERWMTNDGYNFAMYPLKITSNLIASVTFPPGMKKLKLRWSQYLNLFQDQNIDPGSGNNESAIYESEI